LVSGGLVTQRSSTLLRWGFPAGHSLGGAVATLALLRLLAQLPPGARPAAKAVNFACPAIGNAALAEAVRARGWDACFTTFLVPGAEACFGRLLAQR
jgi:alpha-beta hydrolase superfamily lysophospholipase